MFNALNGRVVYNVLVPYAFAAFSGLLCHRPSSWQVVIWHNQLIVLYSWGTSLELPS